MPIEDLTIVVPPHGPDLDGFACALAYAELLRRQGLAALPWQSGPLEAETRYVLGRLARPPSLASDTECRRASRFVYVDGSDLRRLPRLVDPASVEEVIDHHFPHQVSIDYPNAAAHVERVGAAATLVAERFQRHALAPTRDSAILLYCAIHSNTQGLQGSVTTERDEQTAAWLSSTTSMPADIVSGQFAARGADIMADLRAAIDRESKTYRTGDTAYVVAQLEMPGALEVMFKNLPKLVTYTAALGARAMLNMVDVADGRSLVLVPAGDFRVEVADACGFTFHGSCATVSPIQLRKQIVAALEGQAW